MTVAPSNFDAGIREAIPMPVDDQDIDSLPRLGADSLIWKFYGDYRVLVFGFQRLAGTENSIEQLGQAVSDHSVIFNDFLGRGIRTLRNVLSVIYAEDAATWGRKVRSFHRDIKGTVSDGSRYHALNPELFYWAHATFIDHVITITDTFVRRLSYAEKVQIFEEGKTWYALYGVSNRNQPQTYEDFLEYWDDMLERFVPHPTIVYATGYLRQGLPAPRPIPEPVWRVLAYPADKFIRLALVGTLPSHMREACDLKWDATDERRFQRFAAGMRALNPVFNRLPLRCLYVSWAYDGWRRAGVDPRKIHNN